MKLGELKKYTETWSADFSRWPVELVKPALALIQNSSHAKAFFDSALRLDARMRYYDPPNAAPEKLALLESRILKSVSSLAQAAVEISPLRFLPVGRASAGLFAMALLGFIIGAQPSGPVDSIVNSVAYAPDQIVAGDDISIVNGEEIAMNDEGDF